MKGPFIVGVSGISGAGKTTLVKALAQSLSATALFWDDFDAISTGPQDYVDWYQNSRNYDDWNYPELVATLAKLKENQRVICPATKRELMPTKMIFFDAPLGYQHQATGQYIDFLICLDTPLDIALARRLLRDPNVDKATLLRELEEYLTRSRPLFLLEDKQECDLLLEGSLDLETQCQQVLSALVPKI